MRTRCSNLLQVPLSSSFSERIINQQDQFTPEMLLDELLERNINVSLLQLSIIVMLVSAISSRKPSCSHRTRQGVGLTCAAGRHGYRFDQLRQVL